VFDWLKKIGRPAPKPLTGAPAVRRQKTHSALSGYVYQYYYEGQREALAGSDAAVEYVFDVTADRKISFPVSVLVLRRAVESWQVSHGRDLSGAERYAIAKMSLFSAFDERDHPDRLREPVVVDETGVDSALTVLDID
jgi:hypothetical protein